MSRVLYQLSYAAEVSPDCTDCTVPDPVSLAAKPVQEEPRFDDDDADHKDVTDDRSVFKGADMRHGIVMKGLAAGAAALAAVSATVGFALAAGDSIALPSTAKLIAKGVELRYAVQYSCQSSDQNVDIFIDSRENVHGWVAHGSSSTSGLVCDGAKHVIQALVPADPNGRAFNAGQVYTSATLRSNLQTVVTTTKIVIAKS